MPPLSERREDIPELATTSCAASPMRPACRREIGEDTLAALQGHDWPGNVRQLRNVVERLLILAPAGGGPIRADALPNDVSGMRRRCCAGRRAARSWACRCATRARSSSASICCAQVTRFGGNISRTATFVGMERSALHRKLKSLGRTVAPTNAAASRRPEREGGCSMARYAYVNGRYVDHREASVHIEDRGYQLADGVYEVGSACATAG